MDRFVVLLYLEKKGKRTVSKLFCPSLPAAEYYLGMFKIKGEILTISFVNFQEGKVSLEKGESLSPFLEWLGENMPNWKAA